jgi:hypothetical protein
MAGLVPAIRVFLLFGGFKDMDARHKAGHDEAGESSSCDQALTPAPMGQDTPVPPSPQ